MNRQEALDLLQHCLEKGEVVPTKHFREELANESVTFEDAWIVLRSARFTMSRSRTSGQEIGSTASRAMSRAGNGWPSS